MQKLDPKTDGKTKNIVEENIEKLKELFPDVFTEGKIDFDTLRETLGEYIEDRPERYSFNWNGKSTARRIAQAPSTGTLKPYPKESVNWDTTENLFIEGDNLEVLKLLQKSYHKKIKMIYIDPPYNTGAEFVYPDNFKESINNYKQLTGQVDEEGRYLRTNPETSGRYHTDWLNMMYPRLKLARNLLRDDGVIFISIDDNEISNLRKLCDEIFGEENFIDCIVWKKRYGGGAKEKYLVTVHEYVLLYTKSLDSLGEIFVPLDPKSIDRYYKLKDENYSLRGPYRTHPLEAGKAVDDRPNLIFPITAPDGTQINPQRQWYWNKERVGNAIKNGEIEFVKGKEGWTVHSKQYLKDENGEIRQAKAFSMIDDVYSQHGTNEMIKIFGNAKIFPYPKPSIYLSQLINIGTDSKEPSIVLDYFAGSSSTAHAVLDLNKKDGGRRKFVMVQLPEQCSEDSEAYKAGYTTIAEIGKERIRRVIKKIEEEQSEKIKEAKGKLPGTAEEIPKLDLGFKVVKLDSSNIRPWDADFDNLEDELIKAIENIKPDRSEADVLYELLLKYGLDLASPIEERNIDNKTVYIIGAGALIVCLADDISLNVVEGIAALKQELQPEIMRVVFKDAGFKDDVVKTNTVQILKQAEIEDIKSL